MPTKDMSSNCVNVRIANSPLGVIYEGNIIVECDESPLLLARPVTIARVITRRQLLGTTAVVIAAQGAHAGTTKMKILLTCGSVNVKADQLQAIEYSAKYGFDATEPQATYLAGLGNSQIDDLSAAVKRRGLVWGGAGLTVEFRKDDAAFNSTLAELPRQAQALQRAGITRVGTWISPAHESLTYSANMKIHAARLGECAKMLGDHGIRLGLEYVAPKTLWTSRRYAFVHTMAEMRDLHSVIALVLAQTNWRRLEAPGPPAKRPSESIHAPPLP